MATKLTKQQHDYATHVLMFDRPFSHDVNEAIHRAGVGCADNGIPATGVIEFFCGLYLQFSERLDSYFAGDLRGVVTRVFPTHRFGDMGMMPERAIDDAASDEQSGGFVYSIHFGDEIFRPLWTARQLAGAVGKKASLQDIVAGLAMDDDAIQTLREHGITFKNETADFRDILRVIFFVTAHTGERWPRQWTFKVSEPSEVSFSLTAKTPSGGFQPMRKATVMLNGKDIAQLSWPQKPTVTIAVELQPENTLAVDFDGPQFGSMEITVCHRS